MDTGEPNSVDTELDPSTLLRWRFVPQTATAEPSPLEGTPGLHVVNVEGSNFHKKRCS
jgi:hypothetical protein